MVLSITHRGTGLIQSGLMTGFALFPFVTSLSYPAALAQVTEMGLAAAPILFAAKFAIVWPVMFHLLNGFRHLVSLVIINDIAQGQSQEPLAYPLLHLLHYICYISELGHGLGIPNC